MIKYLGFALKELRMARKIGGEYRWNKISHVSIIDMEFIVVLFYILLNIYAHFHFKNTKKEKGNTISKIVLNSCK